MNEIRHSTSMFAIEFQQQGAQITNIEDRCLHFAVRTISAFVSFIIRTSSLTQASSNLNDETFLPGALTPACCFAFGDFKEFSGSRKSSRIPFLNSPPFASNWLLCNLHVATDWTAVALIFLYIAKKNNKLMNFQQFIYLNIRPDVVGGQQNSLPSMFR